MAYYDVTQNSVIFSLFLVLRRKCTKMTQFWLLRSLSITLQTNDYSSSTGVLITWIRPLFHSIMTAIETQQRQQPVRHQKMRDKAIKMGKNINRTQVMGTSSITMPFMYRSLPLLSKA